MCFSRSAHVTTTPQSKAMHYNGPSLTSVYVEPLLHSSEYFWDSTSVEPNNIQTPHTQLIKRLNYSFKNIGDRRRRYRTPIAAMKTFYGLHKSPINLSWISSTIKTTIVASAAGTPPAAVSDSSRSRAAKRTDFPNSVYVKLRQRTKARLQ